MIYESSKFGCMANIHVCISMLYVHREDYTFLPQIAESEWEKAENKAWPSSM